MNNKRYLKFTVQRHIEDCITYEYENYIEVKKENPSDVLSGWYKFDFENNEYIVDEEKKKEILSQREEVIKEKTILELIEWGLIK